MKNISMDYNEKHIENIVYLLFGIIIVNLFAIFTFLKNTPLLLKLDLFFLFFIILDLISFVLSLFSNNPYVIVNDNNIFIDRKGKVDWKDIDFFQYNDKISWLYLRGKKCKCLYGVKTDFLFPEDKKILFEFVRKKILKRK